MASNTSKYNISKYDLFLGASETKISPKEDLVLFGATDVKI